MTPAERVAMRDELAAGAMNALIQTTNPFLNLSDDFEIYGDIATTSYLIADAMLTARGSSQADDPVESQPLLDYDYSLALKSLSAMTYYDAVQWMRIKNDPAGARECLRWVRQNNAWINGILDHRERFGIDSIHGSEHGVLVVLLQLINERFGVAE